MKLLINYFFPQVPFIRNFEDTDLILHLSWNKFPMKASVLDILLW